MLGHWKVAVNKCVKTVTINLLNKYEEVDVKKAPVRLGNNHYRGKRK